MHETTQTSIGFNSRYNIFYIELLIELIAASTANPKTRKRKIDHSKNKKVPVSMSSQWLLLEKTLIKKENVGIKIAFLQCK